MHFENKLVIIVREDLSLSPGKLAVQVAHAAVDCAMMAKRDKTKWFRSWYDEGQRKVVVRAFDLAHLRELEAKAGKAGLVHSSVSDAGLTEVPPGTITCLGVGPAPDSHLDPITGDLKLL